MLRNDFGKKLFAFYNSFLKIKLNCDKENHVNFKYMEFSKEDAKTMCTWSFIHSNLRASKNKSLIFCINFDYMTKIL